MLWTAKLALGENNPTRIARRELMRATGRRGRLGAGKMLVRGDLIDAGMDMLTKPFALDTLGAKVHAMING